MKMRKTAVTLLLMYVLVLAMSSAVYCNDLDSINQSQSQGTQESSPSSDDETYNNVTDVLRGYNALDQETMTKANQIASPIASLIGVLTGVIFFLTVAGVFLTTALDLAYLAVPITRKWLNPAGEMQQGGAPAMGMGMGHMGGMQGGQQQQKRGVISDEAKQALMEAMPQEQSGGGGAMGMPGGMGMGYGGMGMAGGAMGQSQMPAASKSVILVYFKKRVFFMVMFAICAVILTSSVLLDCGLNLAELLYKIISLFSEGVTNVQM